MERFWPVLIGGAVALCIISGLRYYRDQQPPAGVETVPNSAETTSPN